MKEILIHPEYYLGKDDNVTYGLAWNDIAIMELNETVKLSDRIKPACITDQEPTLGSKHPLITAGWGTILKCDTPSNCPKWYHRILMGAELEFLPRKECEIGDPPVNGDEIICANDTYRGSSLCYGDSGGKIKIKTWFFLILLMENKFLAIIF